MGFDKEMLYTIEVPMSALGTSIEMDYTRRDALTDKLKQNPNIIDVAYGDGTFVNFTHMGWGREYKDQIINFNSYPVSWNFLQMMGIKIEEGRDFMPSDENLLTGIGFIFDGMEKNQLFKTVICDGALPRKTFSMGHAADKRFYIECRKIR